MKKANTVREYCVALYEFMVREELEQKMHECSKKFAQMEQMSLKGEYEQVYGKIIGLLDKFVNLLGDERMSFREFNDILDAGFNEIKVGLIPQSSDAVIIGDIERTRLENVKILFFVGVNDGIIPKQSGNGGIISENDKEVLKEKNIELSMTEREKVFIQKFYLYLNMTKPSRKLYLSYSKISSEGKARKMSYLLINIRKLFPNIKIFNEDNAGGVLRLVKIPESDLKWKFVEETLEKDVAAELYGEKYLTSISAIERYSACAFAHFITYGLRLSEREIYDVKASDIGTLYHNTLERFSEKLVKADKTFTEINDEERKAMITESVMEISTDYGNTILYSTKRNEYMISRVITMADRTVWAVANQLARGKFIPKEYEKAFVFKDKVRGRIDRIDTYEDGENLYVKVVDYKTGDSDFDLLDTYYGLKIQLITYMNAAVAMEKNKHPGKEIVPAGMFYYNIKNPFVDDEEKIDAAILEKLRMKGVVNSDKGVIEALDTAGSGKSLAIPVSYNKEGEVKKSSNVLTSERIKQLSDHVEHYIDQSVEEILNGNVKVNPYSKSKKTGCDYCVYNSLCGFDHKLPDCKYHGLKNISEEEVYRRISGQEVNDGTNMD